MKMHLMGVTLGLATVIAMLALSVCAAAPASEKEQDKAETEKQSAEALAKAQKSNPGLVKVLQAAGGYVVFPSITKGGAILGGAYGTGMLYENGAAVGYCELRQATIGAQLGGQTYTEIISFEDAKSLERFKEGKFTFNAEATAVALKSGAGVDAKYRDGVAVFTLDQEGLMAEAAVGGQKFEYHAK